MMPQVGKSFEGDSEVESEDEDDDDESMSEPEEEGTANDPIKADKEINSLKPFANEDGASKSLRNYSRQTKVSVDQDLVLTSSGLNIVKTILPRTL